MVILASYLGWIQGFLRFWSSLYETSIWVSPIVVLEIISDATKLEPISWELNMQIPQLNFCVGEHLSANFGIEFPENRTKILIFPEAAWFTESVPIFWNKKVIPEFDLVTSEVIADQIQSNRLFLNLIFS